MHTDHKVPAEFAIADQSSKTLVSQLIENITPLRKDITMPACESWFSSSSRRGNIYILKDGMLACRRNGKLLFFYNDGDLVGLETLFHPIEVNLSTDFAVVVDEYSLETFMEKINNTPKLAKLWNDYCMQQFRLYTILISIFVNDQEGYVPEVRFFTPGEVISEQGTITPEVYTLMEGRADILKNGQQVGRVQADEVFGTIAGLTSSPRSASVVASTDCMVVVIPREHFKYLIHSKPDTVLKLVEDMADALNSVNTRAAITGESQHNS